MSRVTDILNNILVETKIETYIVAVPAESKAQALSVLSDLGFARGSVKDVKTSKDRAAFQLSAEEYLVGYIEDELADRDIQVWIDKV